MTKGQRIAAAIQEMISLSISMTQKNVGFSFNAVAQLRDMEKKLGEIIDGEVP